jgi:hypothetical protein
MLKYRRDDYGDLARTWSEYRRVVSTPAWGMPADVLHEQRTTDAERFRVLQTSRVRVLLEQPTRERKSQKACRAHEQPPHRITAAIARACET